MGSREGFTYCALKTLQIYKSLTVKYQHVWFGIATSVPDAILTGPALTAEGRG